MAGVAKVGLYQHMELLFPIACLLGTSGLSLLTIISIARKTQANLKFVNHSNWSSCRRCREGRESVNVV